VSCLAVNISGGKILNKEYDLFNLSNVFGSLYRVELRIYTTRDILKYSQNCTRFLGECNLKEFSNITSSVIS